MVAAAEVAAAATAAVAHLTPGYESAHQTSNQLVVLFVESCIQAASLVGEMSLHYRAGARAVEADPQA